jgi:Flp pilus assembly protein TadD
MSSELEGLDEAAAARYQRGCELMNNGQYGEALAEFEAVLASAPDHAKTVMKMGLIRGFVGEFDESIQVLERARTMDPADVDIRNNLALTYVMLGMQEEAKTEFTSVLEIDPGNAVALRNLSFFECSGAGRGEWTERGLIAHALFVIG